MTETVTDFHAKCMNEVFDRVACDLAMMMDCEVAFDSLSTETMDHRPAGRQKIHISFRLGFSGAGVQHHGCLLVALPEAITLACLLMMVPPDAIKSNRQLQSLDGTTKDAILETGNFICGATGTALRTMDLDGITVCFEGCQGVRANIRPALEYEEGASLVVGRARVGVADYPASEMILLIPEAALKPPGAM